MKPGGDSPRVSPWHDIDLTFGRLPIEEFQDILQGGFMVPVRLGGSLADVLQTQLGLDPGYVAGRISTLFLDGTPVDDLNSAVPKNRSRIALSAAMPGLVGATLRRGGVLASLRSAISHREEGGPAPAGEGTVTIKLFNLVMVELGSRFLAGGILLSPEEFGKFVASKPAAFWTECSSILLDRRPASPAELLASARETPVGLLRLSVREAPCA